MTEEQVREEVALWSYQKKTSIMEGDLAGALESDKRIKELLKETNV